MHIKITWKSFKKIPQIGHKRPTESEKLWVEVEWGGGDPEHKIF